MAVKKRPLPRYWKSTISRITGMQFCDRNCGCGENNQLWWIPIPNGGKPWLPGWMNGADTEDIWDWLVEHGKV